MKRIVLLLGCWAVLSLSVQAGELYRWMDPSGKVHYGDGPPADAKQIEDMKFSGADTSGGGVSYETRRATQNFPVVLYLGENCADACKKARALLSKRGIPFSEKMLVTKEEIEAFKALSGKDSVPTLSVGKSYLQGFLESAWNSELDIAGYPKTAPYRAPGLPKLPAAASQGAPASQVQPAYPLAP